MSTMSSRGRASSRVCRFNCSPSVPDRPEPPRHQPTHCRSCLQSNEGGIRRCTSKLLALFLDQALTHTEDTEMGRRPLVLILPSWVLLCFVTWTTRDCFRTAGMQHPAAPRPTLA